MTEEKLKETEHKHTTHFANPFGCNDTHINIKAIQLETERLAKLEVIEEIGRITLPKGLMSNAHEEECFNIGASSMKLKLTNFLTELKNKLQ